MLENLRICLEALLASWAVEIPIYLYLNSTMDNFMNTDVVRMQSVIVQVKFLNFTTLFSKKKISSDGGYYCVIPLEMRKN